MTALTEAAPPIVVSEPGCYEIPEDVYHADPVPGGSLSCSGAKELLAPSCPAIYRYNQDHGRPTTRALDLGSAAHKVLLGEGPEIVVVEAENWLTKAAKEAKATAEARGAVALLPKDMAQIEDMIAELRKHPLASILFDRAYGKPEQSLFWRDPVHGVMRRARLDWLPEERPGKPTVFTDYKTCRSAAPSALPKHIATYGYHQQAAWYLDGIKALKLAENPVFWFCFQEKTAPYLVTVAEVDAAALQIGREKNREAIDTYARCAAANEWPGYTATPVVVSLPAWTELEHATNSAPASDGW